MRFISSKAKYKKQMFLVRISKKNRAGGRFFLVISDLFYYQLNAFLTHYYPQGQVGDLRSNNKK